MNSQNVSTLSRDKRDTFIISALLLIVTLLVFWPSLNQGFLNYDDPDFVTSNAQIQRGLNGASISWAFRSLYIYWQPLTWLSYMFDYQIWGLNPLGLHLTNLLLHVANALLLFLVLKRMTKAIWPSAFVAVLFALHPLHVESVAWIAERKGLLSTLWWILTLWGYLRYVERPKWT